jgi:hypothetical protein
MASIPELIVVRDIYSQTLFALYRANKPLYKQETEFTQEQSNFSNPEYVKNQIALEDAARLYNYSQVRYAAACARFENLRNKGSDTRPAAAYDCEIDGDMND